MPDDFAEHLAELFRAGAICLPASSKGWNNSQLDPQAREYILDFDAMIQIDKRLVEIPWQNVNASDKRLALMIIENARHAVHVMLQSMRENEPRVL